MTLFPWLFQHTNLFSLTVHNLDEIKKKSNNLCEVAVKSELRTTISRKEQKQGKVF